MPKQFYTEKDIEDLFKSGKQSLQVTREFLNAPQRYLKHLLADATQRGRLAVDPPPASPPGIVEVEHASQASAEGGPQVPALYFSRAGSSLRAQKSRIGSRISQESSTSSFFGNSDGSPSSTSSSSRS